MNKMRALFTIVVLLSIFHLPSYSQKKVLLEAGTNVPVISDVNINAVDLTEGQLINLKTAEAICSEEGDTLIPKGSLVVARVTKALRSKWAGTKGRLTIEIKEVCLSNGQKIQLCDGIINFTGQNRTAIAGTLCALVSMPLILVPGSKAVLPANYVMIPRVEVSKYIVIKE